MSEEAKKELTKLSKEIDNGKNIKERLIDSLEKKYKNTDLTDEEKALFDFLRGRINFAKENWDAAINYHQKALLAIANVDNYFMRFIQIAFKELRKAYEIKQESRPFEDRIAPYVQMIEKIKKESQKPIGEVINFESREELTELALVLAYFEEYALLEQLFKEFDPEKFRTLKCLMPVPISSDFFVPSGQTSVSTLRWYHSILNSHVRPEFSYWQPTPLYFITSKKAFEKMKDPVRMIKFLVKNGADINLPAYDGSTPLWNLCCSEENFEKHALLFFELGANPNKHSVDNEVEWTPLIFTLFPEVKIEEEEDYFIPITDSQIKMAKVLIENGASAKNSCNSIPSLPPLLFAIKYGYPDKDSTHGEKPSENIFEFIKYLITKGADVNYMNKDENTAYTIAREKDLRDVEMLLLDNGALSVQKIKQNNADAEWEAMALRDRVCP